MHKLKMRNIFLTLIIILVGIFTNNAFATTSTTSSAVMASTSESLALSSDNEIEIAREWQFNNGLNKNLNFGENNDDIKIVQNALFDLGFIKNQENITGYFGPMTLAAIKSFQKENNIPVTGFIGEKTRKIINNLYFNALCPTSSEQYPDLSLLNVSKAVNLPKDYIPKDLVDLSNYHIKTIGIICLNKNAAINLEAMFENAKSQGINLAVTSGFRSYQIQNFLYKYWQEIEGLKALDEIAPPGNSEHQLGTAVDLTGASLNFRAVDKSFLNSPEYQWLENNSYKYGFIMSYEGKDINNEYILEPWHYRFVGDVLANKIHNENLSLENYLQIFNQFINKIISNIGNTDLENLFKNID